MSSDSAAAVGSKVELAFENRQTPAAARSQASPYETAPEVRGPFHLVALGRFSPNTLLTDVQDDTYVTEVSPLVSPPRQRRRITDRLRADIVTAYESSIEVSNGAPQATSDGQHKSDCADG